MSALVLSFPTEPGDGSVVIDKDGEALQRHDGNWHGALCDISSPFAELLELYGPPHPRPQGDLVKRHGRTTLTPAGELVAAILIVLGFALVMAILGGIEVAR